VVEELSMMFLLQVMLLLLLVTEQVIIFDADTIGGFDRAKDERPHLHILIG
jgi:hypothetical protein